MMMIMTVIVEMFYVSNLNFINCLCVFRLDLYIFLCKGQANYVICIRIYEVVTEQYYHKFLCHLIHEVIGIIVRIKLLQFLLL